MGGPEGRALAVGEIGQGNPRGQDRHRRRHAVTGQTVAHRCGRHYHRIEGVALAPGEGPGLAAQPAGGQEGGVVLEVFLEQGVVGGEHRLAQGPGHLEADVMGDEGGLDVDQVALGGGGQHRPVHGPPADDAVLGVAWHRPAGYPQDARHFRLIAVTGRHHPHFHAAFAQGTAKGFDGGGDPVDPGEINVGNDQDPHQTSASSGCGAASRASCSRRPQVTSSRRPSKCSTMAVQESTQSPQLT